MNSSGKVFSLWGGGGGGGGGAVVGVGYICLYQGCLPFDRKIRLGCPKHNGKRFTSLPQN